MEEGKYHVLGRDFPRKDGIARVTGREIYPSDMYLEGMLYGRILRSPYPHARVKSIDFSEAEKMGAVCLSFQDVPKKYYNVRQVSIPRSTFKDWQVLTDHMRQIDDAFGAVAAETQELAAKAAEAVRVEWEVLPSYMTMDEALAAEEDLIHEKVYLEDREIIIEHNIACTREVVEGDVNEGFKEADVIVENEFVTSRVYHAQLEPKSCVCRPEPDGGVTVWPSTQTIHNTRLLIGEIFDIPLNKVNVVRIPVGGHFGSGIHTNPVNLITVALALKAGRPVKIIHSREEDMYDHAKYPTRYTLKIGAKRDGTLVAGEMKAYVDIGSHHVQALAFLGVLAGWWHSLYRLPNMKYEGMAIYTNKAPACAMQGYGAPQVTFGVETTMTMLAEKLGMDPIELRVKNYVGLGEVFWGQGPTIRSVIHSDGVKELLFKGAELIGYKDRGDPKTKTGRFRRGIGFARGFHTSGTGAPVPGEVKDYSTAQVKVNEDGSIDVLTALMDHGGGTLDALAKLVAEEFGVPFEKVGVSPADTRSTGYDVCTHATRGVYCGGGAVLEVARDAKNVLLGYASRILDAPVASLKIRPDEEQKQGVIYVEGMPEKHLTIREVAQTAMNKNWGTAIASKSVRMVNCPPCFTTYYVQVLVDMETGRVKIEKVVAGSDAGTVINPTLARGQLHGGFYRGAGMALVEDAEYDEKTGKLRCNGLLTEYKMLGAADLPDPEDVQTFFAGTREPTGPMGAKGIGESALNPVAAAVALAIQNATGIYFTKLPIRPEDIFEAVLGD
ncbi:MAG: xanthine dehydrogenase family protein molybdopterin-binding subunit [Deltaproteobacteria bacterium]|nr:xanthine dehydrogenase family protein molybdopterin-binding subunit [Deltaproteobacteria bacterium]